MLSASVGANDARVAWIGLIHDCLARLREVFPFQDPISSEGAFREQFFKLPDDLNGPKVERNFSNFNRSHGQMLSIVRGLDKALQLNPPDSLGDVFWTHTLAALEVAMENHGLDYEAISEMHSRLNSRAALPRISSDLEQFPRSQRVQEPLQNIFATYIDCYLKYITQYARATVRGDVDTGPVLDTIAQATARYAAFEGVWRERIQEVKNEQAKYADEVHSASGREKDDRFVKVRRLGSGTYGFVDEVREVTTGSLYAQKSIPVVIRGSDPKTIQERVENEVLIMSKRLRHHHIASVNIYFREAEYWRMIMLPVADYDLREFLETTISNNYPSDSLRMLDPWFGCLISALAYAHSAKIKHEDIKPSNILIRNQKVFLTDFGTAKDFSELEASTVSDYQITGTPVYWAPEPRDWGRAADVFALGCVFAEMLTVRQKRSLQDFRQYRHTPNAEYKYAYKSNLPKVKEWLKQVVGTDGKNGKGEQAEKDETAITILEQILNMLLKDKDDRAEAQRVKRLLRADYTLFCDTCS